MKWVEKGLAVAEGAALELDRAADHLERMADLPEARAGDRLAFGIGSLRLRARNIRRGDADFPEPT